jgi:putative SOS response-associated peptidase YedK
VIADAFIEGPKDLKLSRPFLVFPRDGQPLALAGIWDEWAHPETGECIRSFAVLTTVANPTLQAIGHHRSPVVLDPDDERMWIDREAPIAEVTALMRPCPTGRLNAHPIDPAIRDPRANGSELLRPTGELVHPEHRYILHEHLQMFGMGEGRARNRAQSRGSDQLPLFG